MADFGRGGDGVGRDENSYRSTYAGGIHIVGASSVDTPNGISSVSLPDLLYVAPLITGDVVKTIAKLGVHVIIAGTLGEKVRVGIYANANDQTLAPGALILDFGEVDVGDGFTLDQLFTLATPLVLEKNKLYWVGYVVQGAVLTARLLRFDSAQGIPLLGNDPGDSMDSVGQFGFRQDHAYGPLLNPAPDVNRVTVQANEMACLGVVYV
jgi:hypothetical protein